MPISNHFEGVGNKVARSMRKLYGKDWKKVFYATENKLKNPGELEQEGLEGISLEEEDHAVLAAFHLAKLEECLAETNSSAAELVEESLDSLCDALEEIDEPELEEEEE